MAGQPPIDFQSHDAGRFTDSQLQPSGIPVHDMQLDLDSYLMRENAQGGPSGTGPSHMHNTQFIDFSYPFGDAQNGVGIDGLDARRDIYSGSARGSMSEHRASLASLPGARASFSSNGHPIIGQAGSLDGSDEQSPESSRANGQAIGDGYRDEFNVATTGDGNDLGPRTKEEKNNDRTPAWSELKTKAGKERKRLPLACIACRRKKIRCSGEKPACKHCLRSRIPCVYKVTTRKAAPRTDYMAMLDKRLKRMEDRIIKIVPKEEQENSLTTRAQVKSAIPGTIPVRAATNRKRIAEEAFGSELEAWARQHPENAEASIRPNILKLQEVEETRLLTEGAEALPSQEIQEHLAEVFFDNLYGQAYHVLHKPSYMRKLKAGTVPPVLILAVCGISARFSTHPQLDSKPAFLRGEQWAKEARDIVMRRYDWPNITILTCLLLLGLHEFGTCYGGRSWALGGMAVRMAFALQLHRDLEYDPCNQHTKTPLSFVDREIRRRTMWACFLMDRFNSSGTDRPMVIREETIRIQLPICESYFQQDIEGVTEGLNGNAPRSATGQISVPQETMGVAAYIIKAIALHGRLTLFLFQGGRDLDPHPSWHQDSIFASLAKQAESFIQELPESLQFTSENLAAHESEELANQFIFLHIIIQRNIMSINHYAVNNPNQIGGLPSTEIPVDFVGKTTSRAFEAGKKISQLIMDAESHTVTAPFAGHCAVLSSIVQMAAAFSKNPAVEQLAKRNLATNVRFIAKMKRFWGTFHYLSENLREQFRACADAANQGPGIVKAPVFQYGDWFDKYPHGVSQSDFEDPSTTVKTEKGDDAVLEAKSALHTVEDFFQSLSPTSATADGKKRRKSMHQKKPAPPQRRVSADNGLHVSQQSQPPQQTYPSQDARMQMRRPSTSSVPSIPYQQMSPTDPQHHIFAQPAAPSQQQYYPGSGQDLLFPPQQQSLLPQLDRQLVFGAYDGSSASHPHISQHHPNGMDFMNMDMMGSGNMGQNGYTDTSAWFMPFNMEPPTSLDGSEDPFANLGMSYGGGVQSINGQNSMGGGRGV